MKALTLILLTILAIGCNKDENEWDSLTDAEKESLRTRAAAECKASTTDGFNNFKEDSAERFADFERFQNWKYEYKKPDGTEVKNYKVWKVDATAVYLLLKYDAGENVYSFIKIPESINQEMIDDLKRRKCNREFTYAKGSGEATASTEITVPSATNEKTKTNQKFTFKYNELAYFGKLREYKKIEKFDDKNVAIKDSIKEYTGTLTAQTNEAHAYPLWQTYENYYPGKVKYCVVKYTESNGVRSYTYPFELDCKSLSEAPAGFVPATDLCYSTGSCTFPD